MCLAMSLSAAESGLVVAESRYGGGRHRGDVPPAVYATGMEMNVISGPIVAVVKLSVGLALLRIVGHTRVRYFIIPIMAVMGAWAVCGFFVSTSCLLCIYRFPIPAYESLGHS